MNPKQKDETLRYFSDKAKQWLDFSYGKTPKVNVSRQRIQTVLDLANTLPARSNILDLGCGGGQLCIALAKDGFSNIYGIDFSDEMIKSCVQNANEQLVSIEFMCASIFDDDAWSRSYEAIVALGLIEYISCKEMRLLLEKVAKSLQAGGSFYLGSRNRLFNLFSANDYTVREREIGSIDRLIDECILFSKHKSSDLFYNLLTLDKLREFGDAHPKAGNIDVTTRHQYTPAELIQMLVDVGFKIQGIHGIHYHPFPGIHASTSLSDVHKSVSDFVFEDERANPALIPLSSSFVLHVTK